MKPPCKDCPHRTIVCRRSCDFWKKYEEERNKDYEKRKTMSDLIGYMNDKLEHNKRNVRRKNKK